LNILEAPLIKTEERAVIQVGYILVRLIIGGFGPGSKEESLDLAPSGNAVV
jgi:hypothetical protein